ncbi:MAG: 8-oxo-dGTP diphosphatase [Firmicutes bacterium]|nr:8-oxo-dGTP diphosphatase [Candidatus Colivicinus equi]
MRKPEKCIITNICLVYNKDNILVIDRKKKDWPGLTFPGGHVEKNEDFNTSVIREVKEETGLKIKNPILCGIEEFKTDKEDRYLMLYYKTNKYTGKIKSSNEGEVFWINKQDLNKYKLSLDLKRILRIMESDKLSELIYYHDAQGKYRSKIV